MRTYLQAKAMAKSLRESLAAKNVPVSHSECLELVAQQFGFGNWNVLAAKIDLETGEREPRAEAPAVSLNQVIPVLRVDSREAAREFYVDVLGFSFDWGSEAGAERGFYAQVSRNDLQLHLTTDSPPQAGADVYFRMEGIDALYGEVQAKLGAARALAIHDTFYDARELAIEDPFGNRLRFVEINPPGVSAR
jgi:catechol 2,3-dioxygenase-like lactoylglutathione lyase family enzyme